MKKAKFDRKKTHQPWLITFADMTLVILILFVLLYSYSETDLEKFESVMGSFQQHSMMDGGSGPFDSEGLDDEFDELTKGGTTVPQDLEEQFAEMIKREKNIKEILHYVHTYATEHDLEDKMTVTPTEKGIEVVLPEIMLFRSGQADLLEEAIAFLDDMAPLLADISNSIEVEGHTDNRPIETVRFPSNWDLSTARANEVIRYLIEVHNLQPERFKAVGYGEYEPIASNKTEEGKSKNRRVVMVISNDK